MLGSGAFGLGHEASPLLGDLHAWLQRNGLTIHARLRGGIPLISRRGESLEQRLERAVSHPRWLRRRGLLWPSDLVDETGARLSLDSIRDMRSTIEGAGGWSRVDLSKEEEQWCKEASLLSCGTKPLTAEERLVEASAFGSGQ